MGAMNYSQYATTRVWRGEGGMTQDETLSAAVDELAKVKAERDNLQRRMAAVEAYWLADPGKWGNNERWQAADAAIRDVPRA
jgi:hypothetical protein